MCFVDGQNKTLKWILVAMIEQLRIRLTPGTSPVEVSEIVNEFLLREASCRSTCPFKFYSLAEGDFKQMKLFI